MTSLPPLHRLVLATKALRQLGPTPVALNGLYQLGLRAGWFRTSASIGSPAKLQCPFLLPSRQEILESIGREGLQATLAEADEVVGGKVRLFSAEPADLDFSPPGGLRHWTAYETDPALLSSFNFPHNDVKFLWEPARFGFAFTLGRAYHFSGDEKYPAAFWHYFETFSAANPACLGPNWMSGQEVALRLMAFAWAGQVFAASGQSTPRRLATLASSIAAHAERIPPTLIYARSQNNNHLLTEAAGLYTAALTLPENPQAGKWRRLGEKWLRWCFENQIDETGEYVQHSTNYHRLMLQVALFVHVIARNAATTLALARSASEQSPEPELEITTAPSVARSQMGAEIFSNRATEALALSTRWLLALTDPESGRVPNLGANDGSYIFPLCSSAFGDFRPVLQAASIAFCGEAAFEPGPWDEMPAWLGTDPADISNYQAANRTSISIIRSADSAAYLRALKLTSRPSHADQLHLDLWWRGQNIVLDPGTYLYNAPPPWDNALTTALVHNTVTVDGLDQMTRAGKFLYLDWAQARIIEHNTTRLAAEHDGYRRLGITHRRTVTGLENAWLIEDELAASHRRPVAYRLHWLLPDWEYELEDSSSEIRLRSPFGWVALQIQAQGATNESSTVNRQLSLIRAGQLIHGTGPAFPIDGWSSPTYGVKVPALSLAVEVEWAGSLSFVSRFTFSTDNQS